MYKIGELSRLTGLPVKTIRFYSDEGVLPPPARTASGYRLYTEQDRARLDAVRALRDLGLDLPTVRAVVERRSDLAEAVALELEVVELELRRLRRTRAILRAALDRGLEDPAHLRRLQALARLNAAERETLVDGFFAEATAGHEVDDAWLGGLRAASVPDLPDDPTDAQLDAWLELAELLADPGFAAAIRHQGDAFWERAEPFDGAAHAAAIAAISADAAALAARGAAPDAAPVQALVDRLVAEHARIAGRDPATPGLDRELARVYAEAADPRAARYWQLLAIINDWPPRPPGSDPWTLLLAGLALREGR